MSYELRRLRRAGRPDAAERLEEGASALVVDVHSPAAIRSAEKAHAAVTKVMRDLEAVGSAGSTPVSTSSRSSTASRIASSS